jgi:hypothetical protein
LRRECNADGFLSRGARAPAGEAPVLPASVHTGADALQIFGAEQVDGIGEAEDFGNVDGERSPSRASVSTRDMRPGIPYSQIQTRSIWEPLRPLHNPRGHCALS